MIRIGENLHLTTGELAFAVPTGVIIGAIVSYLASRRSARDSIQAQHEVLDKQLASERQRQFDQLLWSKRAELYPLLETVLGSYAIATMSIIAGVSGPTFDYALQKIHEHPEEVMALLPQSNVFGGKGVQGDIAKYLMSAIEMSSKAQKFSDDLKDTGSSDISALKAALRDVHKSNEAIRRAMRQHIQGLD